MAALQNDALKDLNGSKTEMTGQDYSYISAIPDPSRKGVGSDGTFGQVSTNVNAAFDYVDILGSSEVGLGDSYLLNSGGTCISPSGTLENRYTYIDNRPKDKPLVNRSLISGVIDDVAGLNPLLLFKSVKSSGTPACQKYRCDVTNAVNGDTGYITPFLSPDFDTQRCQRIEEPSDPDSAIQQKIDATSARVQELKTLVASDEDNEELKTQLQEQEFRLADLLQTKLDMTSRRKEYETLSKETFDVMNSSMTGGLLLAGVILATLVFRRYL